MYCVVVLVVCGFGFGFLCFVFVVVGCCVGGWDGVLVVGGCFFTVDCVYFFVGRWVFVFQE